MAGDTIVSAPNSTWMIHEIWTMAVGNAADFRATADLLDKENNSLFQSVS